MKYDVAISLRWTDVDTARDLYERLIPRLDVFFADESREDFVGTDGEDSFGRIFRDEARIVVVLYRSDWGNTPFTRAEEAAIKQRGFSDGYSFTLWVPMEEPKVLPPYIPPQYIYFDLEEYGIDGLASLVVNKVQESGVAVRPESTSDKLQRMKRRMELNDARKKFEGSQAGVEYVRECGNQLEAAIGKQVQTYLDIAENIPFKIDRNSSMWRVTSWPYRYYFEYYPYATNSIADAFLKVHGQYRRPNDYSTDREWRDMSIKLAFKPTLNDEGDPSWRDEAGQYFSFEAMIELILDSLAEKVYEFKERQSSE